MKLNPADITLRFALKALFVLILGLGITYYLSHQARHLIAGPVLSISTELRPVYNQRIIEIAGTAKNTSVLTLNGRTIHTNNDGVFREPLVLENGYTIMTLRAEDRYGRQREIQTPLIYVAASSINLQ